MCGMFLTREMIEALGRLQEVGPGGEGYEEQLALCVQLFAQSHRKAAKMKWAQKGIVMDGHERDIEEPEQEEEEEEQEEGAGAAEAAAAAGAAEEEDSEEEEAGELLPGLAALGGDRDSWLGEDKQSGGAQGRGRQRQQQQQQQQVQNGAAELCIRGSEEQQAAAAGPSASPAAEDAAAAQGTASPAALQQPAPSPVAPAPSEPPAAGGPLSSTAGDAAGNLNDADTADDDDESAADDPSLPNPSSMLPITHTLLNCSVVVGMHPDQATEFIVALALRLGKPFAIVPCCVYHNEFQWRRLGSGQQVKNLEQLIQYVVEKDPGRVHMRRLPFEGMNRVVWREV